MLIIYLIVALLDVNPNYEAIMSQKIVFYNHFHNGDLHVSRGIIRQIINKVKQLDVNTEFVYSHKNSSDILSDIPNLTFDLKPVYLMSEAHSNLNVINNAICINTWYGQQNYKYMNSYGLTMDCLYMALNDSCKKIWNFSLDELSENLVNFFPYIDYTQFNIETIKNWLVQHQQKKIFIANGLALSDQATNFAITPIITKLAVKHPDVIFILTNVEKHQSLLPNNVIYSSSIIKKRSSDLNENSFLSTHCDVIIGRNSGASTFAMTRENLFHSNKTILLFTNIVPQPPNKFWTREVFRDKVNYSANIICSNETNINVIYNMIHNAITGNL
jgi:hypothetical protein